MKVIKMFKEWYRLAKPNKKYWILQFIWVTIPSICLLFEAYFAANVTTSLVENNYKMAVIFSSIILLIVAIRVLAWDINYRNTSRLIASSYYNIQDKLFEKIINSSDLNFESNSKEKITNTMHNDVYDTAAFADSLCSRWRYLISICLCVGYIIAINVFIALIVLGCFIILYIVITHINESIAKAKVAQRKAIDDEYEAFSQLIDSKNIVKEYNLKQTLQKEVKQKSQMFFSGKSQHYMAYSHLDNDYVCLYKSLIFLVTLCVMFLLKDNFITLTIYLTIISYVSDALTYSSSFFSVLTDLRNTIVSASRIKIILDFDDRKQLQLGSINKTDINGEIDFVRVNYKAVLKDEYKINDLKDVSFHISSRQSVIFKGLRNCGKRTIFYMLRRLISQDSGTAYLDKIRITDYSEKVYNENINFVLTKPYFFNTSIIKNLKMITKNENKIIKVLTEVGFYDDVMKMKDQLNTSVNVLSQRDLYLLGLARMLLYNNEVLLVYEFPAYLPDKDIRIVKDVFNRLSTQKTIIYFTATDSCDELGDKIYSVVNGEVKMVKVNSHRLSKMMVDYNDDHTINNV